MYKILADWHCTHDLCLMTTCSETVWPIPTPTKWYLWPWSSDCCNIPHVIAIGSWWWHCSIVWSCDHCAQPSLSASIGKWAECFQWWQSRVICLTTASQSAGISVNKCTIMWHHTLLLCFLVREIPVPVTSLCKDYLYRECFWRKHIHGYNTT